MLNFGIKSKNIPIVYSSSVIGGLLFFLPILALYYEKSLFSVTNVAIIFSVEAIAFAIFEMPTGAVADLFGRRRTIILANITSMVSIIFLYIGGSMIMFILYAIVSSLARSLGSGTYSALIYDTLKEENKQRLYKKTIGTYFALWPIGASVGSVVGGYLSNVSLSLPILATFIPLLIATILTFFLKEPYYKKEKNRNVLKHVGNSLKLVMRKRQLIILMASGFILMALGETVHLFGPLFFEFKGIQIEYFGWIAAFLFGFSSLGHYFSYLVSEKIGNKAALILSVVMSPLLLLIATLTTNITSIIVFIIPSLFFGLRNPIIDYLINKEAPSSKRATIISTQSFLGHVGLAIFAPLVGYFADIYTINTAFAISALLTFIVPILYLFLHEKE